MIRIKFQDFIALVLFLIQSSIAFSQDYFPMNFKDGTWAERYSPYETSYMEDIYKRCFGDTVIDDQLYYKLYEKKYIQWYTVDSTEYTFVGLITELPDKTVQYIPKGGTNPITIYDFNINIGDTIKGYSEWNSFVVGVIDSVEICCKYHKRYSEFGSGFPSNFWDPALIEGVGYSNGLLGYFQSFENFETTYTLESYWERSDPDCEGCYFPDAVKNYNSEPEIFPNPFNDHININSEQPLLNYRIYNLYGKLVKSENSQFTSDKILETGNLPPGLYLIQVQFIDRSTSSLKMIKY